MLKFFLPEGNFFSVHTVYTFVSILSFIAIEFGFLKKAPSGSFFYAHYPCPAEKLTGIEVRKLFADCMRARAKFYLRAAYAVFQE